MAERRKVSSDMSAVLLEYVLKESRVTQEQLAEALEVSPAFISRVRTWERSFTVDHLAAFEKLLKIPLGVILLAAMPLREPRAKSKKLHDLARAAMEQADAAAKLLIDRSPLSAP